ncbi:MAG: serine/threonine-protein kinase [Polyangiaceae bacterium]
MTLVVAEQDENLSVLTQHSIASLQDDARYRLGRLLGAGSMGFAYYATRETRSGETPVVIKLLRPEYVLQSGRTGALIVQKEVEALSRLSARVPPTPFVVQLVDAGTVALQMSGREFDLPWLALEYVHGGAEGTTLAERVVYCVEHTDYAFDRERAAHAVECIAQGIDAIHEVGVLHRDLTPNNVLCCGAGGDEIFKIADFGLARPIGGAATFGGIVVGTLGYAPPEQAALDDRRIGAWSDVFTFAVDVYFLLTGRSYFKAGSPHEMLGAIKDEARKTLRSSPLLSPDLAQDTEACEQIDRALARATAVRPEERPQTAALFASTILPWLRPRGRRLVVERRHPSVAPSAEPIQSALTWTLRHRATGDRVLRSVAWDGDGRCLAATSDGLAFWDGAQWREAPTGELSNPTGIRFVHRRAAGSFIVGGDDATLATYTPRGVRDVVHGPSGTETFVAADGDFDDLAVIVGTRPDGPPVLYTLVSRRWLKPLPLEKAASIAGLARIADDRWLVTGRRRDGRGFVAEVAPLSWDAIELGVPRVRAVVACAARTELGVGLVAGSEGLVARVIEGRCHPEILADKPDLSAATLDVAGRAWVAAARRIWVRPFAGNAPFAPVWEDQELEAPIVSLFSDADRVVAITAEGSVVEGRLGD